jgi:hypothetical protein
MYGIPPAFLDSRQRPRPQFPLLDRLGAMSFVRGRCVRRLQFYLGFLFGRHNFVSMRCGPALLGSHTRDIHNTAHETTTQDTRSTRPQHADVTTHHKQHSKITTSCSSSVSPLLSTFSRVSTLHIFHGRGQLRGWLRSRSTRGVLLYG